MADGSGTSALLCSDGLLLLCSPIAVTKAHFPLAASISRPYLRRTTSSRLTLCNRFISPARL